MKKKHTLPLVKSLVVNTDKRTRISGTTPVSKAELNKKIEEARFNIKLYRYHP